MSLRPSRVGAVVAGASLALLGAVAVAVAATTPSAGAASSTQSAQSLYNSAIKAASSQGVHFDSVATQSGTTLRVSGDTGATSGGQVLTVTKGNVVENVSALVVGSTGYIKGNSTALRNIIGLTSARANKYAGQWLSFPTSSQGLDSLVAGLKNADVASELQMSGPYSYGTAATIAGQHALAIQGSVADGNGDNVPVILYVSALGTPQPLEQVTNPKATKGSSSIHGTVKFSKWGEKTTETAPAHTVNLLQLAPVSTSGSSSG